jgi:hypothetical protein
MSAKHPANDLAEVVRRTLASMPAWIRTDLCSKDVAARARAEEVLATLIKAAIEKD